METTPTESNSPATATPITEMDRRKLGGAFRAAIVEKVHETEYELRLLHEAIDVRQAALKALRTDLIWIDQGVRLGSIVEWDTSYNRSSKAPRKATGRVVNLVPHWKDRPDIKVDIKVVQRLKDGSWGESRHALYSYHKWTVVTP